MLSYIGLWYRVLQLRLIMHIKLNCKHILKNISIREQLTLTIIKTITIIAVLSLNSSNLEVIGSIH